MPELISHIDINSKNSNQLTNTLKRLAVITVAALIMACNIKMLVRNAGLFPGGATGLTLLIQQIFEEFLHISLPYTVLNVVINSFPIYLGFRYIGKKFTLYSCVMIFLTGIFTDLIPQVVITNDVLLGCIFGGLINGFVISLVLNVDTTTGGTDFIAIYLSEKKGMDSFNIVLGINAVILCTAGFLFGWDKALYSIIFQYVSTEALHLLYRKYQKQTFLIVTNHSEKIADLIKRSTHHSATIMKGEGAYEHAERELVYSVVSASEYERLIPEIRKVDAKAFVNAIPTDRLSGRFYNRPVE